MILCRHTLELAATSASIAAGCIPCTVYHTLEAKKAGAENQDIQLALAAGAKIANEAAKTMVQTFCDVAIAAGEKGDPLEAKGKAKFEILGLVGAAVAVNSVQYLTESIELARVQGITDAEILEIVVLSRQIKEKAASHLTIIADKLDADPEQAKAVGELCA